MYLDPVNPFDLGIGVAENEQNKLFTVQETLNDQYYTANIFDYPDYVNNENNVRVSDGLHDYAQSGQIIEHRVLELLNQHTSVKRKSAKPREAIIFSSMLPNLTFSKGKHMEDDTKLDFVEFVQAVLKLNLQGRVSLSQEEMLSCGPISISLLD